MPSPTHNPFGTTQLDQVLCVEARPYVTRNDGVIYVFIAMDAVSWHAHHVDIRRSNTKKDYIVFIGEALRKYKLPKGRSLAISLPATAEKELKAALPHFAKVICDARRVAVVTQEFHTGYAAQLGLVAMN